MFNHRKMIKKLLSLTLLAALIISCTPDPKPEEDGTQGGGQTEQPTPPDNNDEEDDPVVPDTPSTPVEVQENDNFTLTGSRGVVTLYDNGSAKVTAGGSGTYSPNVKLKTKVNSFDVTFTIKNNSVYLFPEGHFILEGKGEDGISYQFRIGGGVTNNFSTAGAYTPDKSYADANPSYNMNGLDATFSSENITIPEQFGAEMILRFKIGPYKPSDGGPIRIFAQAWLNGEQLLNLWDSRECPWFGGSEFGGCDLTFGVQNGQGSFTIESVEMKDVEEMDQPVTANNHILYDRFEHSGQDPESDYWSRASNGSAAWQYYCAPDAAYSYLENGVLKLWMKSDNGTFKCGAIDSQYKRAFKKCSIEIKARWPKEENPSVGRALWFMPQTGYATYSGWPNGGEIDLMEHTYGHDYVRQTLHSKYIHDGTDHTESGNPAAGRVKYVTFPTTDWHIYRCDITGNDVIFYVNGTQTAKYSNKNLSNETTVQQWPFAAPYYLILSIGAAGNVNTTPVAEDLPAWMEVDYVKITKL